jgi:hypothetical protein
MTALETWPGNNIPAYQLQVRDAWGLTPSRACRCPMVVAGKRCRRGQRCVCEQIGIPLSWLGDHAHLWRQPGGDSVLTLEPYGEVGDVVSEVEWLNELLEPLGCVASVHLHEAS